MTRSLFQASALAAAAILMLGACERGRPADAGTAAASGEKAATARPALATPEGAVRPAFVFDHVRRDNPYWVTVASQASGGAVQYAPETILRFPAERTAFVTVQVLHAEPRRESFEDDVSFEDIAFTRERLDYVLNCAKREFRVVERRIMGEGESVARTIAFEAPGQAPDWRPLAAGGVTPVVFGPACEAQ